MRKAGGYDEPTNLASWAESSAVDMIFGVCDILRFRNRVQ